MYRNDSLAPTFAEFYTPFGNYLDPNNRWVKKAAMIPWRVVEQEYKKHLSGSTTGKPAKEARLAFAALLIKEELQISDRETVQQICENPYLQYFIGLEGFQTQEPFDASMMVYYRARFPEDSLKRINEAMTLEKAKPAAKEGAEKQEPPPEGVAPGEVSPVEEKRSESAEPENQGQLLVDATCAPADIRYPTDLSLLNEAREKTEKIIDILHKNCAQGSRKPRTYRQRARKEFLAAIKKKRKSTQALRQALRQQLNYVKRNLKSIEQLSQSVSLSVLKKNLYRDLLVISELYRQQKIMYDAKEKRIDDRIVSIWFPHVRPIKRGKASADTEFGAKFHLSLVNGFAFMERSDWNPFHEGIDLIAAIKNYRRRFGFYPKSVHVDKIYRNRENREYCKTHGIRLSGASLGRPPKDPALRREQKKAARQDERDRIPIEGKFGEGKRRFGWDRIMAKLPQTSLTVISMTLIVMNLGKMMRVSASTRFLCLLRAWITGSQEASQAEKGGKWLDKIPFLREIRLEGSKFTPYRPQASAISI